MLGLTFWFFLASSRCFVHMGTACFSGLTVMYKNLGSFGVPQTGHVLWALFWLEHYFSNLLEK